MPYIAKDSSFKKTQECLRVVAKEFKFHGYKLEGPCAAVKKAGTNGKFVRNIARDVRRRSSQLHKDQVSFLEKLTDDVFFSLGIFHPRVLSSIFPIIHPKSSKYLLTMCFR